MALVEDVFRLSGIPTFTFVEPQRYDEIKVSIRTPGRCSVVEGPSGIGKTTTITNVISELKLEGGVISLSARRPQDIDFIAALPEMGDVGTVIVDDFHRLPEPVKAKLSDFMKILADTSDPKSKLILIGINKAGQQLVRFAHDLGLRIDVFRLEANPIEKLQELIGRGEAALNVRIDNSLRIAERAQGSFQIVQLLCHKLCVLSGVTETAAEVKRLELSIEVVIEDVMVDLSRQFKESAVTFARGSKIRREGRAPYLHILKWLAESDEWSLDLVEALNAHPNQKGSVGQVLDKGYLESLLNDPEKREILEPYFYYEPSIKVLSVEDPKLVFYLKNVIWRVFTKQVGYNTDYFEGKYDFALSFAGSERSIASRLFELLSEREISVFYDEAEQHRILASNIEEYLAPIYRSEAKYVIPLLSKEYPRRIWTKFESDQFRERFGEGGVIPVRFTDVEPGFFSDEQRYGGLSYNVAEESEVQLAEIAHVLSRRLESDRQEAAAASSFED